MDKAAEENAAPEPDKAPDVDVLVREDVPNDPPLQDDVHIEDRPTDTSGPVD